MSVFQGDEAIVQGAQVYDLTRSISTRAMRLLERDFPLERTGPDVWYDHSTNEYLSLAEALERYGAYLPEPITEHPGPDPELAAFLKDFHVHLIETQRLLAAGPRIRRRAGQPEPEAQEATVSQFADDLTRRLREALALNSRTSQELDRSFPRRVLLQEASPPSEATEDTIRQRYNDQNERRTRLAAIAVSNPSDELPLPVRRMEDWERSFLWTYLNDTDQKLATFQRILDRVQLLREIVNSRFLFKELAIDAEQGFRFISDDGREISPRSLSSGEQHELVLTYDLLFNTDESSLVLIDEPEISLHVAWQQAFLDDIVRIATVGDLRFIVATHSPQIIHKWWDRTVPLMEGYGPDSPGRLLADNDHVSE